MTHLDPTHTVELIERCQRGDRRAFDQLVRQEQQRIYRLTFRIVQRREDVDDLVQEIFLLLYRKIGGFRFESRFSTWLTRLAINQCRRALRRRRFGRLLFGDGWEEQAVDHQRSTLRVLEREEEHRTLREALSELPEKQRLVVILRYFEEMSCEEVAAILDCKIGTVRSRLFHARQRLKEIMLEYENN
jgi:RNA polymerase sigma-70 factor, ECF subfamily